MASIQEEWNAAVQSVAMNDAGIPVVGNVHARPMISAVDLRADIMAQMQSRVRWTESVQWMSANGIRSFVEVGSGSVLIGLIKRIDASAVGQSLGNPADFEIFNS
jgi:[acyl-carrier-protein] S-malonyltransferase